MSGMLAGRRFHMMGVGGAGVSALAQLAAAWGAEVSGCDRTTAGAYAQLARAAGVRVIEGHDAAHMDALLDDAELVVSSAIPLDHPERARARDRGVREVLRGELLGELSALRATVAVGGAHGKSTTTAMIAHAAIATGLDPTVYVGGIVPFADGDRTVRSNARIGTGEHLVAEGDESDRTIRHLRARIAVVTNIERDHHHTYATDDELEALFAGWIESLGPGSVLIAGPGAALDRLAAHAPGRVVRFGDDEDELARLGLMLPVPGRHNALNAAAALAALRAMGADVDAARESLRSFPGVGRRFELVGSSGGHDVVDDYAHHPTEVAATIQAARERWPQRGLTVIFQPHLYSRTEALAEEFAQALAGADRVVLLPIYGAREDPVPGVTEELIAVPLRDAIGDAAVLTPRAMPSELLKALGMGNTRADATDAASRLVGSIMDGDTIITMGAGDVTGLAPSLVAHYADDAVLPWFEPDADLAHSTTIGTGGAARWLATPSNEHELRATLAWAARHGLPVAAVGLGSNTLVDDRGFDGVALKLSGGLTRIEIDAESGLVTVGGGASLAAIVRLCRDEGLASFEFACAIPGTVGGAVKMNAGAYGSEMVDVLQRARLVSVEGVRDAAVADLDMQYRHTSVRADEIVSEAVFALTHDDPVAIKERVRAMQTARSASQPRAARSFGSVFRNPEVDRTGAPTAGGAGYLIEHAGLKGHTVGGARISPKHGNFIENFDGATTADVIELIRIARREVLEQCNVELVPEVHVLGRDGYRSLVDLFDEAGE